MKRALAFSMSLGLAIAAGCGAKVVVDEPVGQGGAGGAGQGGSVGGAGQTSVVNATATTGAEMIASVGPGPGPGPGPTVTIGPGPGPGPNVATSVGSGTTICDGTGDCNSCLMCAAANPCADLWNKCQTLDACAGLMSCLNSCNGDPDCTNKCVNTFPDGIDTYNALAICMVCNACFSDCDGAGSGCP